MGTPDRDPQPRSYEWRPELCLFRDPGTEAEWTGYAENVSPQLSEASFDSMVCGGRNLAQLRCDYKMSLLGKGNKAYFMKNLYPLPKRKDPELVGFKACIIWRSSFLKEHKIRYKIQYFRVREKSQGIASFTKTDRNTSDIQNFGK